MEIFYLLLKPAELGYARVMYFKLLFIIIAKKAVRHRQCASQNAKVLLSVPCGLLCCGSSVCHCIITLLNTYCIREYGVKTCICMFFHHLRGVNNCFALMKENILHKNNYITFILNLISLKS